jgi:hypothetical protein
MLKKSFFLAAVCLLALALSPALHAQQKGTAPAPQPRTYNLVFDFGDTPYTGTMSLVIAKETVTGTMKIDSPMPVTGDVEGTLKGEVLTLDYAFKMESESCGGRVHVDGKMTAKQDEASGSAKTDGGCSPDGQPVSGTFSLKAVADTQK